MEIFGVVADFVFTLFILGFILFVLWGVIVNA
jgi:hypothetical protein